MGKVFCVSNDESGENKSEGQVLGLGAVSREFDCGNIVKFYLVCYKKCWLLISALSKSGLAHYFPPSFSHSSASRFHSTLGPCAKNKKTRALFQPLGSIKYQKLH